LLLDVTLTRRAERQASTPAAMWAGVAVKY
jgi:hypothetical protein